MEHYRMQIEDGLKAQWALRPSSYSKTVWGEMHNWHGDCSQFLSCRSRRTFIPPK